MAFKNVRQKVHRLMTNNQDGPKQARSLRSLCQKGPLAWKKYATAGSGGSDYY